MILMYLYHKRETDDGLFNRELFFVNLKFFASQTVMVSDHYLGVWGTAVASLIKKWVRGVGCVYVCCGHVC